MNKVRALRLAHAFFLNGQPRVVYISASGLHPAEFFRKLRAG